MTTRRVNLSKYAAAHGERQAAYMERGAVSREGQIVQVTREHWQRVQAGHTPQPKGLGDTVQDVLLATGIHQAYKRLTRKQQKPCGCEKRRVQLNQSVPYRKNEP